MKPGEYYLDNFYEFSADAPVILRIEDLLRYFNTYSCTIVYRNNRLINDPVERKIDDPNLVKIGFLVIDNIGIIIEL